MPCAVFCEGPYSLLIRGQGMTANCVLVPMLDTERLRPLHNNCQLVRGLKTAKSEEEILMY